MRRFTILALAMVFFHSIAATGTFAAAGPSDLNSKMWWAVYENRLDEANELISEGADPNYMDSVSLLMLAASNGSVEMVNLLIEHGGDPTVKTENNNTTLMWAAGAELNSVEICQIFLAYLVDPLAKNTAGDHVLASAVSRNNVPLVEYLLSIGVPVDYPGYRGRSALFKSVANESFAASRFLLDHGANINYQDDFGYSALFKVALNGKMSAAHFLIDEGIDVNLRNKRGNTALTIAEDYNQIEMTELIRSVGGIN